MKTIKLLLYKKNPDRIPGHGGKEYIIMESDIEAIDQESIEVGCNYFFVDEYYNISNLEVTKIRYDKKAIQYSRSVTMSFSGNPFGSPSCYEWYEFDEKFPVFFDKEMAQKFANKVKSEKEFDEPGWQIARTYYRNWILSI